MPYSFIVISVFEGDCFVVGKCTDRGLCRRYVYISVGEKSSWNRTKAIAVSDILRFRVNASTGYV